MAKVDLLFRFLGENRDLTAASRGASRDLDGVAGSARRSGGAMAGMKKGLGIVATGLAALGLADYARDALNMAVAAEQIGASFTKTFGPAADELAQKLDDVRLAMGLTESETQSALIRMGQLTKAMGASEDEAAEFSSELFIMAGDLAAFNPLVGDSSQALDALAASIRGEFDPLEQWGVKLSAAAIEAQALADTGKELASELTDLEKAQATVNLITEKGVDQWGALEDAEDTMAQQTARLKAEFADVQAELGAAMIPVLKELLVIVSENKDTFTLIIQTLGDMIRILAPVVKWILDLGKSFRDAKETGNGLIDTVTTFVPILGGLVAVVKQLWEWIQKAWDRLRGFGDWLGNVKIPNPFSGIGSALAGLGRFLPSFRTGGTVPGPRGRPRLAVVHGGEKITSTPGATQRGGGGGPVNVVLQIDGRAIARAILPYLTDDIRFGTGIRD